MFRLNLPKSMPLVLLIIAFMLCLQSKAYAAKITTKTTNSITNSTKETTVEPAKVVVLPPAPVADATAETKAAKEGDAELNSDTNASKDKDEAETEDVEDTDDDDDADEEEEEVSDADDAKPSKSETALEASEKDDDTTSTFSVWGIVRTVWSWIKDDISESLFGDDEAEATSGATKALVRQIRDVSAAGKASVESRTFGKIRRLQMALVPLIFKFGVLTAMVAFLIMLGMKTLFLVKLLVLMNAAAILAKFITLKSSFVGHEHSAPSWNYQSWSPPVSSGWAASAPAASYSHGHEHQPTKEIHLHIHGGQAHGYDGASSHGVVSGGHGWNSRSDPYNSYASAQESDSENELTNKGPIAMLPTRYQAKNPY